jgi:hypothetical protein
VPADSGGGPSVIVDLEPFGVSTQVELEGQLIDEHAQASLPLLVLFDENHDFFEGKRQCVRNTLKLYDAGIVDLIAVEGYSGSVVEQLRKQYTNPPLDALVAQIRARKIPDDFIISTGEWFADLIYMLRPDAPLFGAEDSEAYKAAGEAIAQLRGGVNREEVIADFVQLMNIPGSSPSDIPRWMEERKKKLVHRIQSKMANEVAGPRDEHFLPNIRKARSQLNLKGATIFNAGKRHQDYLASQLKQAPFFSFIRIRPTGFPSINLDAL